MSIFSYLTPEGFCALFIVKSVEKQSQRLILLVTRKRKNTYGHIKGIWVVYCYTDTNRGVLLLPFLGIPLIIGAIIKKRLDPLVTLAAWNSSYVFGHGESDFTSPFHLIPTFR